MSRRKKNRAKRKDAPMSPTIVMTNDLLQAHVFGGKIGTESITYRVSLDPSVSLEPERVHTTIEGRGVVARLKERA